MNRKRSAGATVIEVLIVIAILGILVAIALPHFLGNKEGTAVGRIVSVRGILNTTEVRLVTNTNGFAAQAFYFTTDDKELVEKARQMMLEQRDVSVHFVSNTGSWSILEIKPLEWRK